MTRRFVPSESYYPTQPRERELGWPGVVLILGVFGGIVMVSMAASAQSAVRAARGPWYAPLVTKLVDRYTG